MTDSQAARRNRDATQRRILNAAREVLAEEGADGFGVNAVARRADCDKQLIYRYFGGMAGLTDAVGADMADWWAEKLRHGGPDRAFSSYAALIQDLASRLIATLRAEPLAQKIALWELTDMSDPVRRLAEARSRGMMAFVQQARGNLIPPPGLDPPVINAILIGAIHQFVLSAQTLGGYDGLSLRSEADWLRLEQGLRLIIDRIYGGGDG